MQDAATIVGKKIAEIAKGHGIEKVAFDRGGFAYHGRVKVSHVAVTNCSYGQGCPVEIFPNQILTLKY